MPDDVVNRKDDSLDPVHATMRDVQDDAGSGGGTEDGTPWVTTTWTPTAPAAGRIPTAWAPAACPRSSGAVGRTTTAARTTARPSGRRIGTRTSSGRADGISGAGGWLTVR